MVDSLHMIIFCVFFLFYILFITRFDILFIILQRIDPNHRIGLGEDGMMRLKNHIFYGTEDVNDWYKLKTITPPPFTSSSELSDSRQRSGSQTSQHSLAESPRHRSPTSPKSQGGYLGPESLEVSGATAKTSPRKRGSSFITSLPKYDGASEPQNVPPPIMMNWAQTVRILK